jgi:hypothetical protein
MRARFKSYTVYSLLGGVPGVDRPVHQARHDQADRRAYESADDDV